VEGTKLTTSGSDRALVIRLSRSSGSRSGLLYASRSHREIGPKEGLESVREASAMISDLNLRVIPAAGIALH
jgi:hypothetical protein